MRFFTIKEKGDIQLDVPFLYIENIKRNKLVLEIIQKL